MRGILATGGGSSAGRGAGRCIGKCLSFREQWLASHIDGPSTTGVRRNGSERSGCRCEGSGIARSFGDATCSPRCDSIRRPLRQPRRWQAERQQGCAINRSDGEVQGITCCRSSGVAGADAACRGSIGRPIRRRRRERWLPEGGCRHTSRPRRAGGRGAAGDATTAFDDSADGGLERGCRHGHVQTSRAAVGGVGELDLRVGGAALAAPHCVLGGVASRRPREAGAGGGEHCAPRSWKLPFRRSHGGPGRASQAQDSFRVLGAMRPAGCAESAQVLRAARRRIACSQLCGRRLCHGQALKGVEGG
mmetsp:Transcript_133094/g.385010  ORF Transcript_133094/g.385010 Transcript_133094/m.385010 type:complete len:305 (+) Transcript_133094:1815-2729(+)